MRSRWNPYVLYLLWILFTIIIVPPLYDQLLYVVIRALTHPESLSGWTAIWLLDFAAMLACLVLVGVELAMFRAGRLETQFFLKASGYLVVYWTWNLAWAVYRRDWYGTVGVLLAAAEL